VVAGGNDDQEGVGPVETSVGSARYKPKAGWPLARVGTTR
jgi:hypothetical protein